MLAEISPGEILDKLTILHIKLARITDAAKLTNILREHNLLTDSFNNIAMSEETSKRISTLRDELLIVNETIWDIEDAVRDCERHKTFDERFITAARGVYLNNDRRAELKREINTLLASQIVEEKSYTKYL